MTKYMQSKIGKLAGRAKRSVLRFSLNMENHLEKVCKGAGQFTNPKGEQFIFGKYVNPKDKSDITIVTVASYDNCCNCFIASE